MLIKLITVIGGLLNNFFNGRVAEFCAEVPSNHLQPPPTQAQAQAQPLFQRPMPISIILIYT